MADRPDDMVTPMLRDIQQGQAEIMARLGRLERDVDSRFSGLERDMKELRATSMYVAGAPTIADHRAREVDTRAGDLDERGKAFEAALAGRS